MALSIQGKPYLEIKIDKSGRVVIPQAVREELGLLPGTTLKLFHESEDKILLEVVSEDPVILEQNGLKVFGGTLPEGFDLDDLLKKDRDQRDQKNLGVEE